MAYRVKVGETWRYCDDLTVDEVIAIEAAAEIPWALLNPFRSMRAAKAIIAAFLIADGADIDEAAAEVGALTLRSVKDRFEHADDDDLPAEWEDGLPVVDPKAADSPGTATSSSSPKSPTAGLPT